RFSSAPLRKHFGIHYRRSHRNEDPLHYNVFTRMSDHFRTAIAPENAGYTRRSWHLAAIYVLGAIIGLALAVPTILYLFIPPRQRRRSQWIDAGDVSRLTPGSPVEMSFQEGRIDGWRVITEKKTAWVVKEPNNQIVAFGPQCTHLGCAYHWDSGLK